MNSIFGIKELDYRYGVTTWAQRGTFGQASEETAVLSFELRQDILVSENNQDYASMFISTFLSLGFGLAPQPDHDYLFQRAPRVPAKRTMFEVSSASTSTSTFRVAPTGTWIVAAKPDVSSSDRTDVIFRRAAAARNAILIIAGFGLNIDAVGQYDALRAVADGKLVVGWVTAV